MMHILFRGGGFSNKGDEAMMLTVQTELSRRLPGVNFLLRAPEKALERAHSRGLLALARSGLGVRRVSHFALRYTVCKGARRASRLDIIAAETIADAGRIDGVVDFSGFNYSDEWGIRCARRGLVWADYCTTQGKPHVCLPQAWGPFRVAQVADATRRLCNGSQLVYARDKLSLSFLKKLLGPDSGKVQLAPDIAFLFSGGSRQVAWEFLKSIGVDVGNSRLVAIAPNMRVYERCAGIGAGNTYIRLLIEIAEHCIRAWDVSVILVPHEFSFTNPPKKDDRFLCSLIKAGVSCPDRCFATGEYLSAELVKSIEGHVDFMIGSRFHSCVFSLSSGIPAVALGWTHKYRELMELLGLDGNAIIHTSFDNLRLMEVLDKAWEQRNESMAGIAERLPDIRKNVALVFDNVAAVMGGQVQAR
jgi:colanic acid/amylovoran biosynthesis protein